MINIVSVKDIYAIPEIIRKMVECVQDMEIN